MAGPSGFLTYLKKSSVFRKTMNASGKGAAAGDAGNFVADLTNPQSSNLYSYVKNNPLRFIDPSGLCSHDSSGGYQDSDDGGTLLFSGPCSGGTIDDYNASPTAPLMLNGPDPNNPAVERNTVTEQQKSAWQVYDALSAFFGTSPKRFSTVRTTLSARAFGNRPGWTLSLRDFGEVARQLLVPFPSEPARRL
jgi:hypothetical protein